MNATHYLLIIFLFAMTSSPSFASSKSKLCKKYQKKYQSYQIQQRKAKSNRQSHTLKSKENKAFKQWQRCKQGKLKK